MLKLLFGFGMGTAFGCFEWLEAALAELILGILCCRL